MRIAIISESFPPDVNGVANSVVRVAGHLLDQGHAPLVIAPEPSSGHRAVAGGFPYPVVRVPSLPAPGYRAVRLGLPLPRMAAALRAHRPDVVHLASPFVLGARGASLAAGLGLPTVAVYQTDIPAYTRVYRGLGWSEAAAWRWLRRIHNAAELTLAPSTDAVAALRAHGIRRVRRWGRGVDTAHFHPGQRSDALRRALAPRGEVLVGYVGRLAAEKRVDLLAPLARRPGARVVVVGDGPARQRLQQLMPGAAFLGARFGAQLARVYASLDVFVHTGPYETFGQTVQEAMASGVPVVAPAAGGPRDLVDHGGTGLLVPPADPVALAEAVGTLIASPRLRATFGAAAHRAVAGRTWAVIGDELIDHYLAARGERPQVRQVAVAA